MSGYNIESSQPASTYSLGSSEESDYEEVSMSSDVGDHFTNVISGGDQTQAQCNYCQEVLSNGDDFDICRLKEHLEEECPNYYVPQTSPTAGNSTGFKFDQLKSRKALALCCIKHKYPVNIGEGGVFRAFSRSLNPGFKIPDQNTLEADVISMYEEEKVRVHKLLDRVKCKVSLTTDIWSSHPSSDHEPVAYFRLTSHFIDDNWKLDKKVLAFKEILYPDDSELLFRCIKDMILEWTVGRKVGSITADHATGNYLMVEKLKEWLVLPPDRNLLHLRCFAQVTNLIVQDGFNRIRLLIQKVRETVRYLCISPFAREQFKQAKHQFGLEDRKPVALDVHNRWNSTFDLLEGTLPLKKALSFLQLMDKAYEFNPTDSEWEMAEAVLKCLKIFHAATQHFSGCKYPTSNVFFIDICKIHLKLIEWRDSEDNLIKRISGSMKEKFDKYWDECNLLLAVAVVFDPRYKMDLVEYLFTKIYGSAADPYVQRVRDCLHDLFIAYGQEVAVTINSSDKDDALFPEFDRWCNESRASSVKQKSELDIYLDEDKFPRVETFNVLDWWKINSPRLPTLGKIARDILAIPATTVISEEAFSVEGRFLHKSQSGLRPEVVEALVAADDWIESTQKPIPSDAEYEMVI